MSFETGEMRHDLKIMNSIWFYGVRIPIMSEKKTESKIYYATFFRQKNNKILLVYTFVVTWPVLTAVCESTFSTLSTVVSNLNVLHFSANDV